MSWHGSGRAKLLFGSLFPNQMRIFKFQFLYSTDTSFKKVVTNFGNYVLKGFDVEFFVRTAIIFFFFFHVKLKRHSRFMKFDCFTLKNIKLPFTNIMALIQNILLMIFMVN